MYICIHSIIVIGYAVRPGDWYCGQGHQGVFLFCFEDLVNRKMPRQLFHTTVLPLDIFIPSFLFLSPLSIYISFSPSTLSVCSLLSIYCHVSLSWFFSPIWLPIPCSICVSFPSLYHFSPALCSLCLNFLRPSQYTFICLLSLSPLSFCISYIIILPQPFLFRLLMYSYIFSYIVLQPLMMFKTIRHPHFLAFTWLVLILRKGSKKRYLGILISFRRIYGWNWW